MRAILILWAIPLILFWGWYGLSANNMHFGFFFLERQFHDLVFNIYSNILGLPAEDIPGWIAWVFFVDTLIILAVAALRWYKHWLPQTINWIKEKTGLAEEQREYVQKIYEPLVLNKREAIKPVVYGPVRPAE
ncbi:MAG: DUF6105 family protein [Pseudomonadota bacterium]